MNDKNLKPCPFCGHEGRLYINDGYFNGTPTKFAFVQCDHCYARSKRYDINYNTEPLAKHKAIKAWQKRAGEADDEKIGDSYVCLLCGEVGQLVKECSTVTIHGESGKTSTGYVCKKCADKFTRLYEEGAFDGLENV